MSEFNNNLQQSLEQLVNSTNNIESNIKDIKNKIGSSSGYLSSMRSDNTEEHKTIIHNSEQTIALLKTVKRTMDNYFIIIIFLSTLFFSKMLFFLAFY